jgi:hypothetical protein
MACTGRTAAGDRAATKPERIITMPGEWRQERAGTNLKSGSHRSGSRLHIAEVDWKTTASHGG